LARYAQKLPPGQLVEVVRNRWPGAIVPNWPMVRSGENGLVYRPGEDAIGPIERGMRVNEQIRISPVRVINAEGVMLGVMPTSKALEAAREAGLDLVEVAANERPPVCKIIDFGKFKYTQKKKLTKQKQHQVHIKEIRVRPKTGDHDIEVKVKRARIP
jgi:translation initiation factor IF-3